MVIELDDRPPGLGDGFRVEARVLVWEGNGVLTVPASAVFRHGEGWAVFAIESGRARLRGVTLGRRARLDVEVSAGLDDGAPVVLYPGERVRDGGAGKVRP